MGRRKRYSEVDFTDLNDIILYAYGSNRSIKSRKGVERLFLAVKERIYKDNLDQFREAHVCKDCNLYETKECKAELFCRFDRYRPRRRKNKIIGCPYNAHKHCCYANEVGTCFGCCYKKANILAGGYHSKEERDK